MRVALLMYCLVPASLKTLQTETIDYPPLSPDLSGSWTKLLRVFGPGAIIASLTVGTGETIFAPRVGALFGYAMLWVILAAVVFKAVQVYSGARRPLRDHNVGGWMLRDGAYEVALKVDVLCRPRMLANLDFLGEASITR